MTTTRMPKNNFQNPLTPRKMKRKFRINNLIRRVDVVASQVGATPDPARNEPRAAR